MPRSPAGKSKVTHTQILLSGNENNIVSKELWPDVKVKARDHRIQK